jgi:putative membrane protein
MRPFLRFATIALALVLAGRLTLAQTQPAGSGSPSAKSGMSGQAGAQQTAQVLGKLHRSNVKEIRMGEMARDHGTSKETKEFGKTLIKDHNDADTKVAKLAKDENIDLAANTPEVGKTDMEMGPRFDAAFAKEMVNDHQKDIAEVKSARDSTSDTKLKALLKDLLPVLEKHEAIARKLVEQSNRSAAK